MRRTMVLVLTLAMIVGMGATPVSAAGQPVGEKINVFVGSTTFAADTPFHVLHGWQVLPEEAGPVGKWFFRLDVDGVDQGKGKTFVEGVGSDGAISRRSLFNFEDGLTADTYVFTGHWFAPCSVAVETGLYAGPCPKKNQPVEVDPGFIITEVTVTFS